MADKEVDSDGPSSYLDVFLLWIDRSKRKGKTFYNLYHYIKRICEKKNDYENQRKSLKYKLRERGYSGKGIETQLKKVDMLDRETLLRENKGRGNKKNSSRVPLVLTYSQLLPDIHKIVSKHSRVLHESERMKQVFKDPPIVAFRRDKNLNDTLVHGKTNNIVRSCHSGCKTDCPMCEIVTTHPVMDTAAKNEYSVPLNTSCREKNVVYAISCERCKKVVYVGETERQLNERMKEHIRDVRLRHEKPINSHFQVTDHSSSDLRFTVLKKMYSTERTERQINESAWIKKLQTVQPSGCNVKDAQFQITLLDAR